MTTVESLPIGVYRRVSTYKQSGNERFESSFDDMTTFVQRFGYHPVGYDEGVRSGAHLANRKIASQMLADLKAGIIRGIAAPDISRFTRGEWMEDGRQIAKALLAARGVLITRDGVLDLRRPRDLERYQEELVEAAKDRRRIARRFWEGHYARARKTADGEDQPFGRFRTMLGYRLEMLYDEHGQPRITRRGQLKRGLAKNPERAADMVALVQALETTHTTAELYAALKKAEVQGPSTTVEGGWTARDLRTLLRSPLHRGVWQFVRTTSEDATVWFGLDPAQDEFDPTSVMREIPELAYWTAAQAERWENRFFVKHKPSRGVHRFDHPLLGLLRCPACHEPLLGKGKFGYICPRYNLERAAHGFSTIRESTAHEILLGLVPEMQTWLDELRDVSRAWLLKRQDGAIEVQLEALANQERRIVAAIAETDDSAVLMEQLKAVHAARRRLVDEQGKQEQVSQARIEAERALAAIGNDALAVVYDLAPSVRAELYAAFYEWVEIRPAGAGHCGGTIVASMLHNQQAATLSLLMELLQQPQAA